MFRPPSAACQDVSSFVRYPVFSLFVCVRETERERESHIQEREKLWCGSSSCVVWMFRPSSAACQDVSSFVRHPVFGEYVCVCKRERESLMMSECFVHHRQRVKVLSGTSR